MNFALTGLYRSIVSHIHLLLHFFNPYIISPVHTFLLFPQNSICLRVLIHISTEFLLHYANKGDSQSKCVMGSTFFFFT